MAQRGYCKVSTDGEIRWIEVQWVDKTHQLADPLPEYGASAVRLMDVLKCGKLWDQTLTKICIQNSMFMYIF